MSYGSGINPHTSGFAGSYVGGGPDHASGLSTVDGSSCFPDGSNSDANRNGQQCCGKWFQNNRDFNKHKRRHDPPLRCEASPHCRYRASYNKERMKHYRTTHRKWADLNNIPDTSCSCEVCGMQFSRKDFKKRHLDSFPDCRRSIG
ncbi:hypothetical protein TOPH_02770 [Tolypocladium ophioglossoides CBS 100239]|uniref:C2H2-type domain-containing protein n=1 Tax=Tolypocladium ophioglossoides (strain CBS 100239) TaxID=1163406 RepID=A0A0L0NER9_TOLOC|nr:hypothetical protein TOPH_02770 [Tolypocladium ophioglossoides CBS 100239]